MGEEEEEEEEEGLFKADAGEGGGFMRHHGNLIDGRAIERERRVRMFSLM